MIRRPERWIAAALFALAAGACGGSTPIVPVAPRVAPGDLLGACLAIEAAAAPDRKAELRALRLSLRQALDPSLHLAPRDPRPLNREIVEQTLTWEKLPVAVRFERGSQARKVSLSLGARYDGASWKEWDGGGGETSNAIGLLFGGRHGAPSSPADTCPPAPLKRGARRASEWLQPRSMPCKDATDRACASEVVLARVAPSLGPPALLVELHVHLGDGQGRSCVVDDTIELPLPAGQSLGEAVSALFAGGSVRLADPGGASSPAPQVVPALAAPSDAGASGGCYKPVWTAETKIENRAVAVAPWGDVVAVGKDGWFGKDAIFVLASGTGKLLEEHKACAVPRGFAFLDAKRGVLFCSSEVIEISFPGLSRRVRGNTSIDVWAAGRDIVSVAETGGRVTVYSTKTWKPVDEFTIQGLVYSLAIDAADARVAVGGAKGRIEVRDIAAKKSKVLVLAGGEAVSALAFSPDGSEIFTELDAKRVGAVDAATGAVRRDYLHPYQRVVSMRYLSQDRVMVTGWDSVAFFRSDASASEPIDLGWDGIRGVGLGASGDGSLACVGDNKGTITCFGSRR